MMIAKGEKEKQDPYATAAISRAVSSGRAKVCRKCSSVYTSRNCPKCDSLCSELAEFLRKERRK